MFAAVIAAFSKDIAIMVEEKENQDIDISPAYDLTSREVYSFHSTGDHLQRRLGGKEVQLFAIGGAIGSGK